MLPITTEQFTLTSVGVGEHDEDALAESKETLKRFKKPTPLSFHFSLPPSLSCNALISFARENCAMYVDVDGLPFLCRDA